MQFVKTEISGVYFIESSVFAYQVDKAYAPDHDFGIKWNDKDLAINWGLSEQEVKLSEKDKNLIVFPNLDSPFDY